MQTIELTATDGTRLAASHYAPVGATRGSVLIAPAMGVRQEYYADFAAWLALQGYSTLTFDSRGVGRSRPDGLRSLRSLDADLFDWAGDTDAAIERLLALAPQAPLILYVMVCIPAPATMGSN